MLDALAVIKSGVVHGDSAAVAKAGWMCGHALLAEYFSRYLNTLSFNEKEIEMRQSMLLHLKGNLSTEVIGN